eukprot:CAMPEP_0201646348 /NCGR_PEP_ID=MMETSP0493-20130528/33768_1 /ASSEMBLY_ACC=CAM_ASM_000838 /TAXON_ID=420259 /ORGANISM="Thalassiosira gravida, Strain GMp14c1" /LENGTH=63 /DNA_ID=CAMNT_0048121477 /DNA_START=60 /DNA_END=247 /DNA_ORIENTATION=-
MAPSVVRALDMTVDPRAWYMSKSVSWGSHIGFTSFATRPSGRAAKAASVGAKMVNVPASENVS